MNLKNKITLIFVILVSLTKLHGQSEYLNHRKYWYYKTRLNNDFLKVGLNPGESIPANERQLTKGGTFDNNSWTIEWGDATARLGLYIGVLATEYKMLKNSNQDLTRVKHELFCALNAINRLDYDSECYIGGYIVGNQTCPPSSQVVLNGFFIRDDVGKDFVKSNYNHFNYYNDWDGVVGGALWDYDTGLPKFNDTYKGFTQVHSKGQYLNNSALKHFQTYTTTPSAALGFREVSQDQYYYLMYGLALVSKLVDANGHL